MRLIFIKRLKLMIDLFEGITGIDHLLEAGFGCGILVPELSSRCQRYTGIDIHNHIEDVRSVFADDSGKINFCHADICNVPLDDNSFDCVFSMSVLEHIADIEKAISELKRILKPGGYLLAGFPIENIVSNGILDIVKIMIGFDRKLHHPTNHRKILKCLKKEFILQRQNSFPFTKCNTCSLYYSGVWKKPK